jgi:hypothetical protein
MFPCRILPPRMAEFSGYMHSQYAQSLAEFGTPRLLPRSGGWILERGIPGTPYRDAMGCYPLFSCRDWTLLHDDLEELQDDLVCLTLVADPFGRYELSNLQRCFEDLFVPFKDHCVLDLRKSWEPVSTHHRREARRALKTLTVDEHPDPEQFLDEFMALHGTLVRKHNVSGIRAYSRAAFAKQLTTPGIVVTRARKENTTVGGALWFVQPEEDVVYGHVLGYSEEGYRLGAQYALYWAGIEQFARQVRWCDVGGVPGTSNDAAEGIRQFKRGWSPETVTTYLCGRIFDKKKYEEIVEARGASAARYFPKYRVGEMD